MGRQKQASWRLSRSFWRFAGIRAVGVSAAPSVTNPDQILCLPLWSASPSGAAKTTHSHLKTKNLKLLIPFRGKILPMKLGNKFPWYSAGLHFECLQCGRCCAGPERGYIWVSRPEIRLIADFLKIPVKELKQKFLKRVGLRMTIVEDPHTRDCIFLQQTKQGRGCAIYEVRPAQSQELAFLGAQFSRPR